LFAALVGALAANMSKRAAYWMGGCIAVILLAWLGLAVFQDQMKAKAQYEERSARAAILGGDLDSAKVYLLKASDYWYMIGWNYQAQEAKWRALHREELMKEFRDSQHGPWEIYRAQQRPPGLFDDLIPSPAPIRKALPIVTPTPAIGQDFVPDTTPTVAKSPPVPRKGKYNDLFDVQLPPTPIPRPSP
jgi:hypothetical protein